MTADEEPTLIELAHEEPFSLGPLRVSPATREVSTDREGDVLEPRVMQVLVALSRARGAVVSRDDLVQSCWSGRIVGDDAIHRCIAKVRKLGEGAGAFELETIPRVGYRLTETGAAPAPLQTASKPHGEPVLAVLPFDNLSGDADFAFFSDGVSEEILHALSRNVNLKVIGRASSFQFRAPNKIPRTIAGELKTSHILDGSVRRSGERVRVSAHLMEAATQTVVWSDRFDRSLADIFALQDEIAAAVSAALDLRFAPRKPHPRVSPEAYDLFLRGSVWSRDVTLESQQRALGFLEQAVAAAPTLARAWGELALTRAQLRYLGAPLPDGLKGVHEAAEKALSLDVRAQGAWGALFLAVPTFDFAGADALFGRARKLGLSLNLPQAIHLMDVGRFRDARLELQHALSMDPYQQVQLFYGAVDELADGRLDSARVFLREAVVRWPHVPFLRAYAVIWAAHAGDWTEAHALMAPARLAEHPLAPFAQGVRVRLAALKGPLPKGFMAALRKADGEANTSLVESVAFGAQLAGADAALKDAAVDMAAPRRPELGLSSLFLPLYAALRADPRFPAFCAQFGLAQWWVASDTWPDCADETPYDFKDACRKAVA